MKAPANLVPTTRAHITWLCARMRPDEIEQIQAFYDVDVTDVHALEGIFLSKGGPAFTVLDAGGNPAAVGGWDCVGEGVWQSWALGSMEGWDGNWRAITKSCRWIMGALFNSGARRLQMSAIASRCKTHEWYRRGLKMKPEGVMRAFGRNGEDVHLFAVLKEEF